MSEAISLFLIVKLFYKKSRIYTLLGVLIFLGISILISLNNQRIKTMFSVVKNYKETITSPNTYKESTGLRLLSWNAAINLIKGNYAFGVGTGDIKSELLKEYARLDYSKNLERQMNVHNQFLETLLGQGIAGIIMLIAVFLIPFLQALKRHDLLLQIFLLLMFINFLFESMLNTQAGAIFYGFYYSLLVLPGNIIKK